MKKPSEEGLLLIIGEYISIYERVVISEQIACELLHIEVTTGKFGHITVTIIEQLFGIFQLAIPFTVKSLSDFIKRVIFAVMLVKGITHFSVLFAHISVLGNLVESIFIKEAFGIPL